MGTRHGAGEWAGVLGVGVLVAVLAGVPSVLARAFPPAGMVAIAPTLVAAEDYPQYLASIRDAARTGSLLGKNHFSTEPHRAVAIRPFYSLVGLAGGGLGASPEAAYRAAALGGRFALCLGAYLFAAAFFTRVRLRFAALASILLLSGVTWCLELVAGFAPGALVARYADGVERSEYSTFLTLFHHPHLTLGLGLLLLSARQAIAILDRPRPAWWRAVPLGGSVFLLSITNLFSLVPLGAVSLVLFAAEWRRERRPPLRRFLPLALGGAAGIPFLVYAVRVIRWDPFWSATYGASAGQASPPPDVVVAHLFPLVGLAALGARGFLRGQGAGGGGGGVGRRLAATWCVTAGALMFLPLLQFQMRVAFGIQPFLALPAACGLAGLARGLRGRRALGAGAALALAAILGLLPPILFTRMLLRGARGEFRPDLVFRGEEEVGAARWLAEHTTPEDAVLASYPSGNFLAGRIPGAVYVGHDSGTLDVERKRAEVRQFLGEPASVEDKRAFLRSRGLGYVYIGPYEGMLTSPQCLRALASFLETAFRDRTVVVFRLRPRG